MKNLLLAALLLASIVELQAVIAPNPAVALGSPLMARPKSNGSERTEDPEDCRRATFKKVGNTLSGQTLGSMKGKAHL